MTHSPGCLNILPPSAPAPETEVLPPLFDSLNIVGDCDQTGQRIDLENNKVDAKNENGPFFAKNYFSKPQIFDSKQVLVIQTRPGCEQYYGDASMTETKGENVFDRYSVPFRLHFYDKNSCPNCNKTGFMQFVNCAALKCTRNGHLFNILKGWNQTKCQYCCDSCKKFVVFIERTFHFVKTGYYELSAQPFDPAGLTIDKNSKWRHCAPDYWLSKEDRHTWDGTCFCCKKLTEMLVDGTDTHVSGSGRSCSVYGVTYCVGCNLMYCAAEHD